MWLGLQSYKLVIIVLFFLFIYARNSHCKRFGRLCKFARCYTIVLHRRNVRNL
jgi:hypothetical protein